MAIVSLDSDRALENEDDDQFGFVGIAKRLAPSILEASKGEGIVVGLEGRWGSGKTTLLNFLRKELAKAAPNNLHTFTVAPWLNGDSSSLATSLLNPISEVLTQREKVLAEAKGILAEDIKKRVEEVGSTVRDYSEKTARRLAPLASFAGLFVPGAQLTAEALEAGAKALSSLSNKQNSPSELKQLISHKIRALDVGFVIILDDLDRLEPAQAVEVVRLVRSVADFPNVAYLMCYDRDVLAQALKTGLEVKDGDLFLQKIVQLTFAIPLPEPFDLRTQFRERAEAVYEEATGSKPTGELLEDLKRAVDREGVGLTTPRDVKLALNGIRFVYPSVAEDVYFPDFCRLHLIKTTNFKLYKWMEEYLSVRSVLATGDASLSNDAKLTIGKRLKKLLPSDDIGGSRSIWRIRQFIPGVQRDDSPDKCVFLSVTAKEARDSIALNRLGSPLHYRFYFALTGPKTVMPDAEFNELLRLAQEDNPRLKDQLHQHALGVRQSGKTWFEHILDRLDDDRISQLDIRTASGLVLALSDMMDAVLVSDNRRSAFDLGVANIAVSVLKGCLMRIRNLDPGEFEQSARRVTTDGEALNWLVGWFFRSELREHGITGDRPKPSSHRLFPEGLLDMLIGLLQKRLATPRVQASIATMPDVAAFLYGWRDLSDKDAATAWVTEHSQTDEGFLQILNHLRGWAMSDSVYYPLSQAAFLHSSS